ncbi:MAG: enoyl-CoA hydratase-related protein [Acidimicrobiales bacterium]
MQPLTTADLAALTLDNVALSVTPTKTGDVVTVTMNRPERRNALSLDHMHDLIAAFEAVAQTEAVGVIVAGNGPAFSAGHDFAGHGGSRLPLHP